MKRRTRATCGAARSCSARITRPRPAFAMSASMTASRNSRLLGKQRNDHVRAAAALRATEQRRLEGCLQGVQETSEADAARRRIEAEPPADDDRPGLGHRRQFTAEPVPAGGVG